MFSIKEELDLIKDNVDDDENSEEEDKMNNDEQPKMKLSKKEQ